jgi:hypothetical protein
MLSIINEALGNGINQYQSQFHFKQLPPAAFALKHLVKDLTATGRRIRYATDPSFV